VSDARAGKPPRVFAVQSIAHDGVLEVALTGDLDMAAAFRLEPQLDRLVATPGLRAVCLDMTGIGFLDSTGLGTLISVRERAVALGIEFRIVRASEAVTRLLELSGTRDVLWG
jgi:anti-anti-sigma factor